MGKTDYSKVEKLLIEALDQMKTDTLLKLADLVLQKRRHHKGEEEELIPDKEALALLIRAIKKDLISIKRRDPEAFDELKGTGKEVAQLSTHLENFSEEEWQALTEIRRKVHAKEIELAGGSAQEADEELINQQLLRLEKQGKFNFKANKKWDAV